MEQSSLENRRTVDRTALSHVEILHETKHLSITARIQYSATFATVSLWWDRITQAKLCFPVTLTSLWHP